MTVRIRSVGITWRRLIGLVVAAVVGLTALLVVLGVRAADRNGLKRTVYTRGGFVGTPTVEDVSANISLDFLARHPVVTGLDFSARWEGFWYVPEAAVIDLHGGGDDRLDVRLNGELVIRRTPPADMHRIARTVALDAGVHEVLVEYQQYGGASALSFGWAPQGGGNPRPFARGRLFHERPTLAEARLAERETWLERIVFVVWVVLVIGGVVAGRARKESGGVESVSSRLAFWKIGVRTALVLCLIAVMARAVIARLPGWNPDSLWMDDLIYGALVRADLWTMLAVPIHVAPGLFVIWRGLYALFPDPEWSLQVMPFACGLAAIPVMGLVVRSLTRDDGMALLAAAATAMNPLLAHYSLFVHQYSLDFLVTALFLLAATVLLRQRSDGREAAVWPVALAGGLATFFSVPSVFVSFPLMHLRALSAARDRHRDRRRTVTTLLSVLAYDFAVLAAYLFMRGRTNEHIRGSFAAGFMPLDSLGAAWEFATSNGRFLLDMSLPDLGVPPWPLPFVGLGLVGLLARRSTRLVGLVVAGAYCAFLAGSASGVYPLGTGRPDIFAFPLAILLLAAGVHHATALLPRRRIVRLASALGLAALAIVRPIHAEYRGELEHGNGRLLVDHLVTRVRADDGLILMPGSEYLTAFYGPWPYVLTADDEADNATHLTLVRDRTLHLDDVGARLPAHVERYLSSRPDRIWVVSFWRGQNVNRTLERHGYAIHAIERIPNGGLYLALDRGSRSAGADR